MTESNWPPTASIDNLRARAKLLSQIRSFFAERDVLEVDTPLLSHGTITDVYLDPFECTFIHSASGKPETLFLQTSPEYAMKRLLCAQSGAIYQICKAFRHEGGGRWHNPEFTMLEWYRPGFDHHALMDEMDSLLQRVLHCNAASRITYADVFQAELGIDPLSATKAELMMALTAHDVDVHGAEQLSRDDCLQLLFSYCIEPVIGQDVPCFVYGFPVSQAALARVNPDEPRTADRFEVYFKGVELANGFFELSNADEQRKRFESDNALRRQQGKPERPIDNRLLEALSHGLPDCAGVALGVDRLLMLQTGANHINDVLSFPVSRA